MILRNKTIIIIILILTFTSFLEAERLRSTYATKNIIGQTNYLNRCSTCHGEAKRGGNMAAIREWKEIFSNKASELIDLHLDDDENIEVLKYLKSKFFLQEKESILKILQEFAYDSEHIPTCN